MSGALRRLWPGSLFGRLSAILCLGLALSYALNLQLLRYERRETGKNMMVYYLAQDLAASVAILERVAPLERAEWRLRFARQNYRYTDAPAQPGAPLHSPLALQVGGAVAAALGPRYPLALSARDGRMYLQLRLADATPLTVELVATEMALSPWSRLLSALQLLMLTLFTWLAVRWTTRPLAQLARAADALGPEQRGAPLPEDGPLEVARAARAFNDMQRRIATHLAERMHILAAISHDLQTPITRLRLRADMLDSAALRDKFQGDLDAMQVMVEEGIAYARSTGGASEKPCRTDLDALLDSLVCDYRDVGQHVTLSGRVGRAASTRPHALRRVVGNLLDNAIKFGGAAAVEVAVRAAPGGGVEIAVLDRGPGIPPGELYAVLQPFYRVEGSRNRATGGTGLGLAIAQQLALALGGSLALANRAGGGLEARLLLPLDGV
ncbi:MULTISPECIES: ATP-binding protein [unclassified Janthinobacterium]|uniref:ATP-binding protein n=1 Tax=unclassified Janthinobacterium TaxID=2610881 RepID=UPI00034B15E4|nr:MULTISPECIES: ATP-binding protein [unclassified Janthinobacterium]MEC5160961.1 signal transduction histidine kinase [Janthinobacterium sp. CG_S6]